MKIDSQSDACTRLGLLVKDLENPQGKSMDVLASIFKENIVSLLELCSDAVRLEQLLESPMLFRAEFKDQGKAIFEKLIQLRPNDLDLLAKYATYLKFHSDYPGDEEAVKANEFIRFLMKKGHKSPITKT